MRYLACVLFLVWSSSAAAQELSESFGPPTAKPLIIRSPTDLTVMKPVLECYLPGNPNLRIEY